MAHWHPELDCSVDAIIRDTLCIRPRVARAPYGLLPETIRILLNDMGYAVVNWNLDTEDWRWAETNSSKLSQIVQETMNSKYPGACGLAWPLGVARSALTHMVSQLQAPSSMCNMMSCKHLWTLSHRSSIWFASKDTRWSRWRHACMALLPQVCGCLSRCRGLLCHLHHDHAVPYRMPTGSVDARFRAPLHLRRGIATRQVRDTAGTNWTVQCSE